MSERPETPAERLARTSEIYRRMRAEEQPVPLAGPIVASQPVERDRPQPEDPAPLPKPKPVTPPREPGFVRRLITRRPDTRELLLLGVIAAAVIFAVHPF